MKIIQQWKVTYKIQPTLSKSEEFGGFQFTVDNSGTHVIKRYEKRVILDQRRIKNKTVLQEPPLKEVEEEKEKLRQILLKKMIYTSSFHPIKIESEFEMENKDELNRQGFTVTKTLCSGLKHVWDVLDIDNVSLSSCEEFWTSSFLVSDNNDLKEDILLISDWIERSVAEKRPIQSFMMLWVAFNCLFDLFCIKLRDMKKIKEKTFRKIEKTIEKLFLDGDLIYLFNNHYNDFTALVEYDLIVSDPDNSNGPIKISNDLKRKFEENVRRDEIFRNVMRCVYEIRNNLFHGGAVRLEIERQSITAKNILLPTTTKMLRNLVNA